MQQFYADCYFNWHNDNLQNVNKLLFRHGCYKIEIQKCTYSCFLKIACFLCALFTASLSLSRWYVCIQIRRKECDFPILVKYLKWFNYIIINFIRYIYINRCLYNIQKTFKLLIWTIIRNKGIALWHES